MEKLTLLPLLAILAIAGLLGFWLFAPFKDAGAELNAQGNAIQWVWAKIKALFSWIGGLFSKKTTPVSMTPTAPPVPVTPPTPVTPPSPPTQPMSELLDNLPPKHDELTKK